MSNLRRQIDRLDRELRRNPDELDEVRGEGAGAARAAIREAARQGGGRILLVGPPGSGKTMLARRAVSLLPRMTDPEREDVEWIHSAAGQRATGRPFRAPHHTLSIAGMIGSTLKRPARVVETASGALPVSSVPGEAALATHGVLFLDELPEFGKPVIEALVNALRQRASRGYAVKPAMIIATANECACGATGTPRRCQCTQETARIYRKRLDAFAEMLGLRPVAVAPARYEDLSGRRA